MYYLPSSLTLLIRESRCVTFSFKTKYTAMCRCFSPMQHSRLVFIMKTKIVLCEVENEVSYTLSVNFMCQHVLL